MKAPQEKFFNLSCFADSVLYLCVWGESVHMCAYACEGQTSASGIVPIGVHIAFSEKVSLLGLHNQTNKQTSGLLLPLPL